MKRSALIQNYPLCVENQKKKVEKLHANNLRELVTMPDMPAKLVEGILLPQCMSHDQMGLEDA